MRNRLLNSNILLEGAFGYLVYMYRLNAMGRTTHPAKKTIYIHISYMIRMYSRMPIRKALGSVHDWVDEVLFKGTRINSYHYPRLAKAKSYYPKGPDKVTDIELPKKWSFPEDYKEYMTTVEEIRYIQKVMADVSDVYVPTRDEIMSHIDDLYLRRVIENNTKDNYITED